MLFPIFEGIRRDGGLTSVTASISRGQFLSVSAKNSAALLVAGASLAALTGQAAAALPSTDLAYARLLVGGELLASDFYSQAIAASNTGASVMKHLKLASFNEQEHYHSVAGILSGSGVTPAGAGDITFSYPAGTFASQQSIVSFAQQLEATILGAYLGAIGQIQTSALLTGLAEIAACEAQHESYFAVAAGGQAFRLSFPPALTISQASNAFAAYSA